MWWQTVTLNMKLIVKPSKTPFVVFIDDSLRNFTASNRVLAFLVSSSEKTPTHIPVLCRRSQKLWYSERIYESYDSASGIPTQDFYALANNIVSHANEEIGRAHV